jgi:hypothetical protein
MRIRQPLLSQLACLLTLAWVSTATAQDRTYWKSDRGYVENTGGKDWVGKSGDRTVHWVEVQRNGKLVELYDKSRDVTVHLYDDCYWVKDNKGWRKGLDGSWVNVAAGKERNYWKHGRGHFENTTGNTWTEKLDEKTKRWVEVERTDKYIELYNKVEDSTVRLYIDRCTVKLSGKEQFREVWQGRWGR